MLGKRWPWRSSRSTDASRLGHSTACRAARRLNFESLESRIVLSGVPLGAMQQDTGEFLLGDVTTTVVLLESTGAASSEDWTADSIAAVKANVEEALTWWQDTLAAQQSVHSVQFHTDYQYTDNPVLSQLPNEVISIQRGSMIFWMRRVPIRSTVFRMTCENSMMPSELHMERIGDSRFLSLTMKMIPTACSPRGGVLGVLLHFPVGGT